MAHPKPFHIRTPLPSINETAQRLGVSHSEVLKIENLVDEAMNGKRIAVRHRKAKMGASRRISTRKNSMSRKR